MDRFELVLSARLERERAQKAQYTAMILRALAVETRETYRALRLALRAGRPAPAWTPDRPGDAEALHLPERTGCL